ncbi:hypothetical protein N781_15110 [Pontibacillus halophilus JSM 076056 = DSM 19796]|uniref:RNase H type-1 domain-containing protein n=1 Tax=Pontibacillus halophilus JSM 076056 = DSM 19796 TaxID=1385510 RepID=A0A0A5I9Y7_9BACI|nr:reverse transcriptase-like protein [Pontibacillus halophilus]KGX92647.1 hypothetical protein N781_15110 [Pontibacillus halophilus JSM 076056 = DSM 19796]
MNVRIHYLFTAPKKKWMVPFTSDVIKGEDALQIADVIERTGRARDLVLIDEQNRTWNKKEFAKLMTEIETEPHHLHVYFDGGFDQKGKRSGLGCVIYYEQNGYPYRFRFNAATQDLRTNNEAEYAALHLAIQQLEEMGVHHLPVTFTGDSKVVINQLLDEWPTLEESLNKWADRIEQKLDSLGISPSFDLVTRKDNREADRLASQALEGVEVRSTTRMD